MEFRNEGELRDFLISYLESIGEDCFKEYTLPNGGRVDILTEKYVIECKFVLNRASLDQAAGQLLGRYMHYFPGHQAVIAGLASDNGRTTAAGLMSGGTQVWLIDEIEDIQNFYEEIYGYTAVNQMTEESSSYNSEIFYSDSSDGAGCLGIAVVIVVLMLFGGIAQYNSPIHKLHRAAIEWDINTANLAILALKNTGDDCNNLLANRVEVELYTALNSGLSQEEVYRRIFNRINAMQLEITQQYTQCVYPPLNHPDQLP
jgi:hypothetical protein